ncbi:MAG: hypothetical protein Q4C76_10545 [Bacillota bacterium]|nr:hypothetical protein [Bacillota bacterium]
MARKILGLITLTICLLGLSGCVFGSVDEMYALPKSSEAYVNLQARINEEKGSSEYIAPLSGENRQTIQLVDLDGDGVQEAVAFFRDNASDAPLKIVLLRQDSRGEYQVIARIEGVGSEIESIDYLDLCGRGGVDILVSWQVSPSVHTLVGYSLVSGEPVEILRTGYERYLAADLDGDGRMELALAQTTGGSDPRWCVEYYDGREGAMERLSAAPLSEGATDISTWTAGVLKGEVPALFVTSYFGKDVLITDVLCPDDKGLRNLSLTGGSRQSPNVFHDYTGVRPTDMNGDGLTDVPVGREIPAYGSSAVDAFWWLDWKTCGANGKADQVMTTCHGSDGWYLELPETWTEDFSMCWQENAATGVRSVTFAKGVEADQAEEEETQPPQPFLTICAFVGADRDTLARQGERFILQDDGTTVYTGELLPGWDCGLDQDDIIQRFHHSPEGWRPTGR